jgi:hypothetical protein
VSEVEYYVDVTAGLTRTYHPAYQKLAAGFAPSAARILVIPHYVTPDAGGYAGRRTPVSLNEAFIPVCANTGDENCQSYWPSYFVTGIKRWPDAARPIPLAIDRTTGTVSAADSAALWTAIRNMELDLGRSLYKAVNFTGYTSAGYTAGAVLASYDPTLTGFGAYTNWSWDGGGNIYQAKVRFSPSSRFSSGGLMTHELNHTLGFHHTCRWATVMGGYGCAQQARLSETDVAYYHLAELVARATGTVRPTWGIVESMAGERLFELGVVSAASVTISSAAHRSRLGQSGEDGAP